MNRVLNSSRDELERQQEEAAYEHEFRAKVQEALDSQRPRIAHEDVMARIRRTIEAARQAQK